MSASSCKMPSGRLRTRRGDKFPNHPPPASPETFPRSFRSRRGGKFVCSIPPLVIQLALCYIPSVTWHAGAAEGFGTARLCEVSSPAFPWRTSRHSCGFFTVFFCFSFPLLSHPTRGGHEHLARKWETIANGYHFCDHRAVEPVCDSSTRLGYLQVSYYAVVCYFLL